MGILLQISAWAVITIAADYTFHKYLCPKDIPLPMATIIEKPKEDEEAAVIQTMAWQLASQPNSLLFDFSGLGIIDRQHIFDVLHSNLSPLITAGVQISKENPNLMELSLQSNHLSVLNHTRSILKYRGMKINNLLYLLPTRTLSYDPHTLYWVMKLFHLPLDPTFLLDQVQHRQLLAEAIPKSFNGSLMTIKPKNIFYETVTPLSNMIYTGSVFVLMKEIILPASVIVSQRRFVYLSCYKRHFKIDIKRL